MKKLKNRMRVFVSCIAVYTISMGCIRNYNILYCHKQDMNNSYEFCSAIIPTVAALSVHEEVWGVNRVAHDCRVVTV